MKSGKITQIGNSEGVTLPKEMLDHLKLQKGDPIFYIETERGIEITPYDPELDQQMEAAKVVMQKNRNVLRKLAGTEE